MRKVSAAFLMTFMHPQEMKVTIVHSQAQLLNDAYPAKFRKDMERRVRLRGVEIVFEDRIEDIAADATSVTTKKGVTLNADIVVFTTAPLTLVLLLI